MFAENVLAPRTSWIIFHGEKTFLGAKFQIDGAGTNEGAEKKHKTAKSFRF